MSLIIGVDFDNTIVCYDRLFHQVALSKGLIPATLPQDKESIRNYLRKIDQEACWTELQGDVYGVYMQEAIPYVGVKAFFTDIIKQEIPIYIISHKTKYPYLGPQHDLHAAAYQWLDTQDFNNTHVFFERTKEAKLARIKSIGCTHFIDDLPEILMHKEFPLQTAKILFNGREIVDPQIQQACKIFSSWDAINSYFHECLT
jgi:hypothetical protein